MCVKSLEASVFDLSRAVTKNDGKKAFSVLHKLFAEKEKPELILGTMIMAFVDMYRAKVAVSSGEKANLPQAVTITAAGNSGFAMPLTTAAI